MSPNGRLAVVGLGGIGGTLAGYLSRAGRRLIAVDVDAAHVHAIKDAGLTIEAPAGEFTVPISACSPRELEGGIDVVLLAVKAHATQSAVHQVVSHLTPGGYVVSLQNGLAYEIAAGILGESRVVPAFVNFGADWIAPGRVRFYGHGPVSIGEIDGTISARVRWLVHELAAWGEVKPSRNIIGLLWTKLGYIAMLAATALVDDIQVRVMRAHRRVLVGLAGEVYDVARAERVTLEADSGLEPDLYLSGEMKDMAALDKSFDGLIAFAERHHKPYSGIWRDLKIRHRPTEVPIQLREVIRRGERHRLPLPLTRRLVAMIIELEEGRRTMADANLLELAQLGHTAETQDRGASDR